MVPKRKTWTWRDKVLAECARRRWSVTDLGREIGLKHPNHLNRWLSGATEPRWDVLPALASALGWTVSRLLDEEGLPEDEWTPTDAQRFLVSLPRDARKVVTLLGDPQAASFLAQAAEQYLSLRRDRAR